MKLVDDVKQFVSVLRKMLRRKESKRVEFGSTEAEGNLEHLGGRLEPRQRPQLCLQTLWYAYATPMLCKIISSHTFQNAETYLKIDVFPQGPM